jgi:HAD superfamily hydrolase (TIGR01509 family)
MRAADLDAVTLDAYGTLVQLVDPVPALVEVLAEHGVERTPAVVLAGFRREAAYYAQRASEGRDETSLTRLRRDCANVFLEAVEADLDTHEFASAYVGAIRFEVLPGVVEAIERLHALGLGLALFGNWDLSLRGRLEELGLAPFFSAIVHAAGKPEPDGLLEALRQLGVTPMRAVHIGDDESDEQAARAAGVHFEPAPASAAVAALA